MIKVIFEKMYVTTKLPKRMTEGAVGFDIYYPEHLNSLCIKPQEQTLFGLGFKCEIPKGYYGALYLRSSLGKKELSIPNSTGIIDSDYRGEVKMLLRNNRSKFIPWGEDIIISRGNDFNIFPGDRIAQLLILPYPEVELVEGKVEDSFRGDGGFGSTGK